VGATAAGISVVASAAGVAVTLSVCVTIWDGVCRTVDFGSAVLADVARLVTLVAGLASSIEGSSVWRSAVTRDMSLSMLVTYTSAAYPELTSFPQA
jgi:hypothetical protein